MSRFDLFFVIFDEKNDEKDAQIAKHIVGMHRMKDEGDLNQRYTKEQLQTYIKITRQLRPQFERQAAEILKQEYKKMRSQSK